MSCLCTINTQYVQQKYFQEQKRRIVFDFSSFFLPRSVILYVCPLEPSEYFKYVLLSELCVYWRENKFWKKFRISCSFLLRSPSIIASHINSSIWIMSKFHVTTQNFNSDPHRKYLWTFHCLSRLKVSLQWDTLKTQQQQQKSAGVRERNRQTTENVRIL